MANEESFQSFSKESASNLSANRKKRAKQLLKTRELGNQEDGETRR